MKNIIQNRSSKKKQQKRRMKAAFFAMTVLFMTVIGLSFFSMHANANSVKGASDYKYYGSYCIEPGDSLWSIAEQNMDHTHYDSVKQYVKEIQKINKISGEYITNGTYIIIPYFSDEVK